MKHNDREWKIYVEEQGLKCLFFFYTDDGGPREVSPWYSSSRKFTQELADIAWKYFTLGIIESPFILPSEPNEAVDQKHNEASEKLKDLPTSL